MASKAPFVSSIRCIGFNFPKAVLRTVRNRIDRWLSTHAQVNPDLNEDTSPHYQLVLQREGDAPVCLANMELRIGSSTLRATSYAHDTQGAVSRCLDDMGEMMRRLHTWTPFTPPPHNPAREIGLG